MYALKWSAAEKKLAHRVFEEALATELAEIMTTLKKRVAAAAEPDEMWAIQEYLERKRREIDRKYDYRYSQLPRVFAQLLRQGHIQEAQLAGLAEEKLECIRHLASF